MGWEGRESVRERERVSDSDRVTTFLTHFKVLVKHSKIRFRVEEIIRLPLRELFVLCWFSALLVFSSVGSLVCSFAAPFVTSSYKRPAMERERVL